MGASEVHGHSDESMSMLNECMHENVNSCQVFPNASREFVDNVNVEGRDALVAAKVPVEPMAVDCLSQGDMVCRDGMSSVSGISMCHSLNVSNVRLCRLENDRQVEPQQRVQRFADEVGDFPGGRYLIELVGIQK